MIGVTFLGLFLTPVFYAALRRTPRARPAGEETPSAGAEGGRAAAD
jgi:hypothetical protein